MKTLSSHGLILVVSAVLAFSRPSAWATLRLEGLLKAFAYPADTNGSPFRTATFELLLDDCRWSLLLTNFSFRRGQGHQLAVRYSSDCKDWIEVKYWTQASVAEEKRREIAKNPSRANAYKQLRTEAVQVSNGVFPKNKQAIEIAPWMAFCFPNTGASNLIPNVFAAIAWPTNRIRAEVKYPSSFTSSFPERITLWKPGHANRQVARAKLELEPLPAPFDQGYVGFIHEVTSWDKTALIPTEFIQTHFSVSGSIGDLTPSLAATVIVIGSISHFSRSEDRPMFDPTNLLSTLVLDKRTNFSIHPLVYEMREYGLLNADDPNLDRRIDAIRRKMQSGPSEKSFRNNGD